MSDKPKTTTKCQEQLLLFLIIFPFLAIPLCFYFEMYAALAVVMVLHFIVGLYLSLKNRKLILAKTLLIMYSIAIIVAIVNIVILFKATGTRIGKLHQELHGNNKTNVIHDK